MGKASRWIRNLLLGKKEDKIINNDGGGGAGGDDVVILSSSPPITAIVPATPSRRWSFRRSNSTQKVAVNHKNCRSFDSIMSTQLLSQALFDYAIQHQNHTTKLVVPSTTKTSRRVSNVVAISAATKIQAAFRSYLARKALCALRGLVKLQALVRGHLVRKRTAAMVRCMSALVAIQVRARFQRIQLVEDSGSTSKQGFMRGHERQLSAPHIDYTERSGRLGSKTNQQLGSRRFSIDSLSLTQEKTMRLHRQPADKVDASSQTSMPHDEPNYMTKTESSRAKARSQSAPRHRPTKQRHENRRTLSNESLGAVKRNHQNDHEGSLAKLYGSSKSTNDCKFDSASTCTNGSSYYTNLYDQYEMAESLY